MSGLRDRIRLAIETPVREAEKLRNELTDADSETRLSILIDGWCRGLASAIEELAIAIDELRQPEPRAEGETSSATPAAKVDAEHATTEDHAAQADLEDAGEERLSEEAKRSREQTAELQEQTKQARSELEG
jgi:hypothetical protein